jgi:hypothetical protein
MQHAEDRSVNATTATPVFVDDTGRRRTLTRWAGRLIVIGFVGYLGLLAAGFARDPRLGSLGLPTFGLPALHPEPAPVVLGDTTARTAAEATGAGAVLPVPSGSPSDQGTRTVSTGPPAAGGRGGDPASETGSAAGAAPANPGVAVPVGGQAATTTSSTTTTTPAHPGNGSKPTTTTTTSTAPTAPSSSTTSTTTTTMAPGQGSGPVSATGPDGTGAPGQQRKATTTTTGPKR